MKLALIQLNGGPDVAQNLERADALIREAIGQGAEFVATPEVTNLIAPSRDILFETIRDEQHDESLAALRALARELGISLLIGSLALRSEEDADKDSAEETDKVTERESGRACNRSFLIGPDGAIRARYDKIHMFEADLGEKGRYREAKNYRPGEKAVLAPAGNATLGMTICYDLRFPQLYRDLARAGAQILSVPSAFTVPTGKAHWHVLLRARAIETGCFLIAPAQWGKHGGGEASFRESYGHSLIIAPWGEVLADAGEGEGIVMAELDLAMVEQARARIPSLTTGAQWSSG